MPRGYPDYQNPVNQVAGRLVDFAGIQTAQLGQATLDGLGRLIWYDLFHEGLFSWELVKVSTGVDPAISILHAEIPPSCVALGLPANAIRPASGILRSFQLSQISKVGLEFSVLYNQAAAQVILALSAVVDGVSRSMLISYRPDSGTISLGWSGGETILMSLLPALTKTMWIPIKLVIDVDNNSGLRAIIGDQVFSLVDYTMLNVPLADCNQVSVYIYAIGDTVVDTIQYIGHVYLTADEP